MVRVANLFAVAGFFIHPWLHFAVRHSPALERAMHGYVRLWLDDDRVALLRFGIVWLAEIIALWIIGAVLAAVVRRLRAAWLRRWTVREEGLNG